MARDVNQALAREFGLSADEYQRVLAIMGRTPSLTELGVFSVMPFAECSAAAYEAASRAVEGGILEDGDPPLPQLHKNHGDALYRAGRYDDALEAYERAIRANPALGDDVYLRVGNIRFKARDQNAAIESWERALELNPANDTARANLELARTLSA